MTDLKEHTQSSPQQTSLSAPASQTFYNDATQGDDLLLAYHEMQVPIELREYIEAQKRNDSINRAEQAQNSREEEARQTPTEHPKVQSDTSATETPSSKTAISSPHTPDSTTTQGQHTPTSNPPSTGHASDSSKTTTPHTQARQEAHRQDDSAQTSRKVTPAQTQGTDSSARQQKTDRSVRQNPQTSQDTPTRKQSDTVQTPRQAAVRPESTHSYLPLQLHPTRNDTATRNRAPKTELTPAPQPTHIQTLDSIAVVSAPLADSIPTDSLASSHIIAVDSMTAPSSWRTVPTETVFGSESTLFVREVPSRAEPQLLTQSVSLQGYVLLLALAYGVLIYRNLLDVRSLLIHASHDRAGGERLMQEPGSGSYSRFLNIATTIGVLFLGVAAIRLMAPYVTSTTPTDMPWAGALLACLAVSLAFLAVMFLQFVTIKAVGAVTLTQEFVTQLILIKRTYFSLATILISPFVLLLVCCPPGRGNFWLYTAAGVLILLIFLYLREVLHLFINKKVSILHWILYLCVVEIFPLSLIVLLALKNFW